MKWQLIIAILLNIIYRAISKSKDFEFECRMHVNKMLLHPEIRILKVIQQRKLNFQTNSQHIDADDDDLTSNINSSEGTTYRS